MSDFSELIRSNKVCEASQFERLLHVQNIYPKVVLIGSVNLLVISVHFLDEGINISGGHFVGLEAKNRTKRRII